MLNLNLKSKKFTMCRFPVKWTRKFKKAVLGGFRGLRAPTGEVIEFLVFLQKLPTYVLSNIGYWELGPKLFFEVNFAFFWKLAFSHCNWTIQYTVNYNGKTPTFRKMQNSTQKIILAPFLNSLCSKWYM